MKLGSKVARDLVYVLSCTVRATVGDYRGSAEGRKTTFWLARPDGERWDDIKALRSIATRPEMSKANVREGERVRKMVSLSQAKGRKSQR